MLFRLILACFRFNGCVDPLMEDRQPGRPSIVSNVVSNVSNQTMDFGIEELASFTMARPSFSLDVIVDVLQHVLVVVPNPAPVAVPKPAPKYEELAFELGLNMVLDADFIAMFSMLESSRDVPGGDDEAQASEVAQILSEDPEFQRVLA